MQAVIPSGATEQSARRSIPATAAWFFARTAECLLIAIGFALPLSTSATLAMLALLAACWLLSGEYAAKWRVVRHNRVAWLALTMFAVYALGVTYSTAPPGEAMGVLLKYRKLLYVPVFVTVLACAATRTYALRAFQIAMLVTLAASFLMRFGLVHSRMGDATDCAVFKSHVTQNVLMAFFVALLVQQALRKPRWRWLYAVVVLIALYNILFMVDGRTGYLILIALLGLWMFRRGGWRGLAVATVLAACLGAAVYGCSSGLRQRVNLAVQELADYYYFQRDSLDSSIGRRCSFYRTAAVLFLRRPVLGSGTGSFRGEFARLPENQGKAEVVHPHSEYLTVLVQTGLLGLGVFLAWLLVQWKDSRRLPPEMSVLAQTLIVTFAVSSLFNSSLSDTTEGYLYCLFLGFCYAEAARKPAEVVAETTAGRRPGTLRRHRRETSAAGRPASTASS